MPLVLQGWKCQTAKIYATTYCTLLEWQQVFLFYLSKKSFIIACFKFVTPDCGREKEGMETEPRLWDIVIFQDIGVLFTTHRLGRGKKGKQDHFTLILDHFQRALLCQDGQEIVSFSSFFSSFFAKGSHLDKTTGSGKKGTHRPRTFPVYLPAFYCSFCNWLFSFLKMGVGEGGVDFHTTNLIARRLARLENCH